MRSNDTLLPDADPRDTTRGADMAAFDALPPPVRAALNDHPLCMSAEDAIEAIRQGYSIEAVLSGLRQAVE